MGGGFRLGWWVGSIALIGVLSGCGNETAASSPTTSTTNATTTIPTKPFQAVHSWNWTTSNNDGYKFAVTLNSEAPQRLAAVPLHSGFTSPDELSATCAVSASTDALLPVEVKLTNATPSFTSNVQASFAIPNDYRTMNDVPQQMQVIGAINNAPSCISMGRFGSDGSRWTATCPGLPPTHSCTTYAYIVLNNYFTPSYPNGNPAVLQSAQLYVVQDVAPGFIDTMTGSGIDWSKEKTAMFSLSGAPAAP